MVIKFESSLRRFLIQDQPGGVNPYAQPYTFQNSTPISIPYNQCILCIRLAHVFCISKFSFLTLLDFDPVHSSAFLHRDTDAGIKFVEPFLQRTDRNLIRRFNPKIIITRARTADEPDLTDHVLTIQIWSEFKTFQ
jgi:hypothetical protein